MTLIKKALVEYKLKSRHTSITRQNGNQATCHVCHSRTNKNSKSKFQSPSTIQPRVAASHLHFGGYSWILTSIDTLLPCSVTAEPRWSFSPIYHWHSLLLIQDPISSTHSSGSTENGLVITRTAIRTARVYDISALRIRI